MLELWAGLINILTLILLSFFLKRMQLALWNIHLVLHNIVLYALNILKIIYLLNIEIVRHINMDMKFNVSIVFLN